MTRELCAQLEAAITARLLSGEPHQARRHRPRFADRAAYTEAVRLAYIRAGFDPIRAEYDAAGRCTTCGDERRGTRGGCPEWHINAEVMTIR